VSPLRHQAACCPRPATTPGLHFRPNSSRSMPATVAYSRGSITMDRLAATIEPLVGPTAERYDAIESFSGFAANRKRNANLRP
jgi:hypothetical protein